LGSDTRKQATAAARHASTPSRLTAVLPIPRAPDHHVAWRTGALPRSPRC